MIVAPAFLMCPVVPFANSHSLHLKLFLSPEQIHGKNDDIDQWRKVRRNFVHQLISVCVYVYFHDVYFCIFVNEILLGFGLLLNIQCILKISP